MAREIFLSLCETRSSGLSRSEGYGDVGITVIGEGLQGREAGNHIVQYMQYHGRPATAELKGLQLIVFPLRSCARDLVDVNSIHCENIRRDVMAIFPRGHQFKERVDKTHYRAS